MLAVLNTEANYDGGQSSVNPGHSEDESMSATTVRQRMLAVNVVLAVLVISQWALLGGARAFAAMTDHWQVALTMTLGSLVGGGTSEGGGAIAFPVLTKALEVPAEEARLFSFAIQSIGMTAASISILVGRVRVEWNALAFGGPAAVLSVIVSFLWVAPRVDSINVRLAFTAVLAGLLIALVVSRSQRPGRRRFITERRADTTEDVLPQSDRVVLIAGGTVGGLLSGVAAVGENTVMFVIVVLLYRVSEAVATPTTVILMTMATLAAFVASLVTDQFTGPVVDLWLAAVPVVCAGAPLGALICTMLSEGAIVKILYSLISIEFASTVLLIPATVTQFGVFGVSIVAFGLLAVRLATIRRFDVQQTAPTVRRSHANQRQ